MISVWFLILVFRNYRDKKKVSLLLDRKLDERTKAFKESHVKLMRDLAEREAQVDRICRRIAGSVRRINSLCLIGMQEVSDPVVIRYLEEINISTEQMHRCVVPNLQENKTA